MVAGCYSSVLLKHFESLLLVRHCFPLYVLYLLQTPGQIARVLFFTGYLFIRTLFCAGKIDIA